jgi:DNA-binding response OmpR family regulator
MTMSALTQHDDIEAPVHRLPDDRAVVDARVLIVDDDPSAAWLMERVIVRSGFRRVRSIDDGARAIRAIAEWPPDVLVLDVHMPGIDGFAVLRELERGNLRDPAAATRVLAVSGDHDASICEAMLAAGADDFIFRPFETVEFSLRVRQLARMAYELKTTRVYLSFLDRTS